MSTRYTVIRNGAWWAVWDGTANTFAKHLGTWLSMCGMDEAFRLAGILNKSTE